MIYLIINATAPSFEFIIHYYTYQDKSLQILQNCYRIPSLFDADGLEISFP